MQITIASRGNTVYKVSGRMSSLQELREQGVDLPYGCQYGGCITCAAKLIEGEIDQRSQVALNNRQINNGYIISGILKSPNTNISKNDFDGIVKNYFNKYDIREISLGSNNNFKFKINKNFKFEDFELKSIIDIYDLQIKNSFQLKNFFHY